MLSAVEPLSSEEIDAEPAEIAAEDARKVTRVSDACQLAIDIEMLINERAEQIGKGAGVVIRAATMRVAARADARRHNDPREGIDRFLLEHHRARGLVWP
jgi:hypothetical protein